MLSLPDFSPFPEKTARKKGSLIALRLPQTLDLEFYDYNFATFIL